MEILGSANQLVAFGSRFCQTRTVRCQAVVLGQIECLGGIITTSADSHEFIHLLLVSDEAENFHEFLEVDFHEGVGSSENMGEILEGLGEPLLRMLEVVNDGALPGHPDSVLFPGPVDALAHVGSHLLVEAVHVVVHYLLELALKTLGYQNLCIQSCLRLLWEEYGIWKKRKD